MTLDWTKLPSLTALRSFEAVARARSFSEAARSMNVTHAAIAQQVRLLEAHVGVKLVDRSPRGVSLTLEGNELARALTTGFTAIAEGIEVLMEKDRKRPVRVTTTALFAEAVIFPKLATFWSAHPEVEVSFTPSDTPVDLVAEGLDLAVRAGEGSWPGLTSRSLLETAIRAYAAPSLVDDPDTDWDNIPWLIPKDAVWERSVLDQSGIDLQTLRTLDLGNPSLKVRAGEEGVGLILEAEVDLIPQLRAGTLKVAPIPIRCVNQFHIVTPPWKPRPAVAAFAGWLKDLGRELAGEQTDG